MPEAVAEGAGAPGAPTVGDAAPTAEGDGEPPGSAAAAVAEPASAVIASTHVPTSRVGPNPAPTSAPPSRVRVDRIGCSGVLDHQIGCCGQELYDCCPGGHGGSGSFPTHPPAADEQAMGFWMSVTFQAPSICRSVMTDSCGGWPVNWSTGLPVAASVISHRLTSTQS